MTIHDDLAAIRERAELDEWCRREDCRHRHHASGSVPTHRRCEECPDGKPPARLTKEDQLRLVSALQAVVDFHSPRDVQINGSTDPEYVRRTETHCAGCSNRLWPCPTIRAINDAWEAGA